MESKSISLDGFANDEIRPDRDPSDSVYPTFYLAWLNYG